MKIRPILLLAVGMFGVVYIAVVHADLIQWRVGGSNNPTWREWTNLNMMIDITSIPTAIQPYKLEESENLVPRLSWTRYKFPIVSSYTPGMPRIWPGVGTISSPKDVDPLMYIDGDVNTYSAGSDSWGWDSFLTLDLGVQVPAERFVFYPPDGVDPFTQEPYRPNYKVPGYEVSATNDESFVQQETSLILFDVDPSRGGNHSFDTLLARVEQNFNSVVEVNFPLQYLRFFRVQALLDAKNRGNKRQALAELEIYGRGYVPRVTWESLVIDMGQMVSIGKIIFDVSKWRTEGDAELPAPESLARAKVYIRTGLDDSPRAYYTYNDLSQLTEVDPDAYERLKPRVYSYDPPSVGWRGPIADDSEQWSFWSRPQSISGGAPQVPPGRYIQLRVRLETDELWEMARVGSLMVVASSLLANQVLGEVAAVDDQLPDGQVAEVPVGEPTEFVFEVLAEFDDVQQGFDAVRIRTPSSAVFKELAMGEPLVPVSSDSVVIENRGFVVYLPQPIRSDESPRLRIRLETTLYEAAGTLGAEVFSRTGRGFPQQVVGGDVSDAIGTNQLRVLAQSSSQGSILSNVEVHPPIFTPQGDGVNDLVQLSYNLLSIQTGVEVEVAVYSLNGERQRQLFSNPQDAGPHRLMWDGRDETGHLLVPGIYLVQITAKTDKGLLTQTRRLSIVY
jgi:hypothetical protein